MAKLKFEEFQNEVVKKIREFLPETFKNAEISLQVVYKNNDMKLTGLLVRSHETNITPTIYLEQFYQQYENGLGMDDILQKIADLRVEYEVAQDFEVDTLIDWNIAKNKLVPRLVGTYGNTEFLESRPYTKIADLAVIYYVMIDDTNMDGLMNMPVTNQIMNKWNVALDELHQVALSNLSGLMPISFRGMSEVLCAMTDTSMEEFIELGMPQDEFMYVLTNDFKVNGATSILDKDTMNNIVERFGEFYILPSSIHEMLIVPKKNNTDVEALKEMVCSVNDASVAPEERLSNNVYTYTLEEGLVIAG